MTDTANLGLPLIEAGQAQKHVTHNEALQRLDALIQIVVADRTRTAPPASPTEGERHIVAAGATGAWSGQANAIAHFAAGGWDFIMPAAGWCVWSIADNVLLVFDGAAWRDLRNLPVSLDNAARIGINTSADASNLLSVKSNAALFAAIAVASGGSGDVRLQLSKEMAAKTASVFFSDAYSGRAEFGLIGSDAFKLKVSPDGSAWIEAFVVDQASGNLALPRGLSLSGVLAPPQLTADQSNYAPAGLAAAAVLQLSADTARCITGLAGGTEGRIVSVINVGSQPLTLTDEGTASLAANRFALGGSVAIAARQAIVLRYDGTAARWQAIASTGASAVSYAAAQPLTAAQQAQARANLGGLVLNAQVFTASGTFTTPAGSSPATVYRYRMVGGGGGGGGAGPSSSYGMSGGGGAGAYAEGTFTGLAAATAIAITVGAGGGGGSNAGGGGGNGGNTSIGTPVNVTAGGGLGAAGVNSNMITTGGAGGVITGTPNMLAIAGQAGLHPVLNTSSSNSGNGGGGGSNALGQGGSGARFSISGNGSAATGYGSGGGGAGYNSTSGGVGAGGILIIEWVL